MTNEKFPSAHFSKLSSPKKVSVILYKQLGEPKPGPAIYH